MTIITNDDDNLTPDELAAVERIFDAAIDDDAWVLVGGWCPFCVIQPLGGNLIRQHESGVHFCEDCDTFWIDDTDFKRLTESEEARAARLAGEYQAAHSEPLFGLAGDGDA